MKKILLTVGTIAAAIAPITVAVSCGSKKEKTAADDEAYRGETLPQGFKVAKGVTSIGFMAFVDAILPQSFTLPDSITSIGVDAFENVKFPQGFTLPNSVKTIGESAFHQATLPKGFTIPSSVTIIDEAVFERATLPEGFTLPNSITSIIGKEVAEGDGGGLGEGAFEEAALPEGFTLPNSITSIGYASFRNTALPKNFKLPNSLTSIGKEAFNTKGAYIEDPVMWRVGEEKFAKMTDKEKHQVLDEIRALPTNLTIPTSVTKIGEDAFNTEHLTMWKDGKIVPAHWTSIDTNTNQPSPGAMLQEDGAIY